ncbi:chorismate mutase [Streptomyces sp. LE64]|uniref:chorismate mutase n=1 Tax=Streptomyces sp. LE64 TaxID=3448653 RepID=UPI0040415688
MAGGLGRPGGAPGRTEGVRGALGPLSPGRRGRPGRPRGRTRCAPARRLDIVDVPPTCAQELAVDGATPRAVRIPARSETDPSRSGTAHVYLGATAALRKDTAP